MQVFNDFDSSKISESTGPKLKALSSAAIIMSPSPTPERALGSGYLSPPDVGINPASTMAVFGTPMEATVIAPNPVRSVRAMRTGLRGIVRFVAAANLVSSRSQ